MKIAGLQLRLRSFLFLFLLLLISRTGFTETPQWENVPSSQAFYDQAIADSVGQEWKPLFNGKDFDGWKVVLENAPPGQDPEKIFQVADGEIHVYRDTPAGKRMPFGVLLTDESYSEYRFRFEYRWGEKKFAPRVKNIRDAGMLFHVVGPEKIWPMSVECQVQEKETGDSYLVYTGGDAPVQEGKDRFLDITREGKFAEFYRPGKITRIVKGGFLETDGWNEVEVIVRKDAAIFLVNGKINNYIVNLRAPIGPDKKVVPLTSGRLALQCECSELFYRKVELLSLEGHKDQDASLSSFVPADESSAPVPPLEPKESLAAWQVREGYRIELMAAEPLTMDPVAIDWGMDGRLWIVEMADYPNGLDGNGQAGGRVRFLEDTDHDGHYDQSTLFLQDLNFPTGIVTWNRGVIITAAPEIIYAEDSNGDGVCDKKTVLFSGFMEGNQQLRMNGLRWGLDGWLHCASGSHVANYGSKSQIHSHLTGEDLVLGSRDFRFDPRTGQIEPLSGPSQFGRNRDDWGNWFGVQNSYPLWHYVLEEKYLRRNPHVIAADPKKLLTPANPPVFAASDREERFHSKNQAGRFTSACSGMVYRDVLLFPGSDVSHAFTCEPVHNLVQHHLLDRAGVSFEMRRDAVGETVDFLASRDRWCRPVMVRTGPDGALWVVDMYRYVIEHPHWLPQEGKDAIASYLRAGDGRGRIYRVLPEHGLPHPPVAIEKLNPQELVKLLEHPNGWLRDTAQQLLMKSANPECVPALLEMFTQTQSSQAKIHALYTLQAYGKCDESLLCQGLNSPAFQVRRHALRLAETIPAPGPQLAEQILKLMDDPEPAVQLQLACSLGEWKQKFSATALTAMLERHTGEGFLRSALLSSLNAENLIEVTQNISNLPMEDAGTRSLYQQVVQMCLACDLLSPLKGPLASASSSPQDLARSMIVLDAIVHRRGISLQSGNPWVAAGLPRIIALSHDVIVSNEQPEWLQLLAARMLFMSADSFDEDLALASSLLDPAISTSLQAAVIQRLGEQTNPQTCEMLLRGWPTFSPALRSTILEVISNQPAWYPAFANVLDNHRISVAEVDLSLQQRFLGQTSKSAKPSLFARHFQQPSSWTTPELLEVIRSVQSKPGHAEQGRQVFQKHCTNCHQFRGEGHVVGPNLESLTNKTPASLLEAIIAPNRSVESKYLDYSVVTTDGRITSGIITNESNHSLTLLRQKGESSAILRSEIEEFRSTGKSLMPEGLDRIMTQEEMRNLVAYLLADPSH